MVKSVQVCMMSSRHTQMVVKMLIYECFLGFVVHFTLHKAWSRLWIRGCAGHNPWDAGLPDDVVISESA